MIWFFERGTEVVRIETRRDGQAYEIVVFWGDNDPETERFTTVEPFEARVSELQRQLDAQHFTQAGPPVILSDGWRGPTHH